MQWIIREEDGDTIYDDKEWAITCLRSVRLNNPDAKLYEREAVDTKLDI